MAVVARAALHHWEEPPISGTRGSGTVFFSHCALRCCYCQNRAISRTRAGCEHGPSELADAYLGLQGQGAHNVNLVTPTHFAPAIRESIRLARARGLVVPVLWNTSGYEAVAEVRANAGLVDAYLTDFKYADAALGQRLSGVPDYPDRALEALRAMVDMAGALRFSCEGDEELLAGGVIVRHLLLPGHLDDSKRVVGLLNAELGNAVGLSLMSQYTPVLASAAAAGDEQAACVLARNPELGRSVSTQEYERLLDFADGLGIEDYYWQSGEAASESFIPAFAGPA